MQPETELQPEFSSEDAIPTPWSDARGILEEAKVYWLATVHPDERPNVTPLICVWMDGALYFCTGAGERKAKNIAHNARCVIMTGCNLFEGLDVVVEGDAVEVKDDAKLQRVADAYASKYDPPFRFSVRDGVFLSEAGGKALVYEVAPVTAFGFGKGEPFSQTRWRF